MCFENALAKAVSDAEQRLVYRVEEIKSYSISPWHSTYSKLSYSYHIYTVSQQEIDGMTGKTQAQA